MREQLIQQLTAQQLAEKLQQQPAPLLLDVRQPDEVARCKIAGAKNMPMHLVPLYLDELPDDQVIVVYCHHGMRSQSVIQYLLEAGFDAENLYNLQGGIDSWAQAIDPAMPRY